MLRRERGHLLVDRLGVGDLRRGLRAGAGRRRPAGPAGPTAAPGARLPCWDGSLGAGPGVPAGALLSRLRPLHRGDLAGLGRRALHETLYRPVTQATCRRSSVSVRPGWPRRPAPRSPGAGGAGRRGVPLRAPAGTASGAGAGATAWGRAMARSGSAARRSARSGTGAIPLGILWHRPQGGDSARPPGRRGSGPGRGANVDAGGVWSASANMPSLEVQPGWYGARREEARWPTGPWPTQLRITRITVHRFTWEAHDLGQRLQRLQPGLRAGRPAHGHGARADGGDGRRDHGGVRRRRRALIRPARLGGALPAGEEPAGAGAPVERHQARHAQGRPDGPGAARHRAVGHRRQALRRPDPPSCWGAGR